MHFDLYGIFLEREGGIRSIGFLRFSDCRIFAQKVDLCTVLSSSVLVSSVPLPTSMSNTGGTWDNAKKDISTSEHVPMVLTLRANMLFCNLRDCHPTRVVDKKNGRFSITDFFHVVATKKL